MNVIELRKLEDKKSVLYQLAYNSYNDIFNNSMSRGKIKLAPYFLGQESSYLHCEDMFRLFSHPYKVSGWYEGERFLCLIGNKTEFDHGRKVFLVDSNMDFWIFHEKGVQMESVPYISNILMDGYLLLYGKVTVTENRILIDHTKKAAMVYIATDILYGPTDPKYEEEGARMFLNLGASGAFIGPKGGYRWPWPKRYSVLEMLFHDTKSPLFLYQTRKEKYKFSMVLQSYTDLEKILRSRDPFTNLRAKRLKHFPVNVRLDEKFKGLWMVPANTSYVESGGSKCGVLPKKLLHTSQKTLRLYFDNTPRSFTLKSVPKERQKGLFLYTAYCISSIGKRIDIGILLSKSKLKREEDVAECKFLKKYYQSKREILFEFVRYSANPYSCREISQIIKSHIQPFTFESLKLFYTDNLPKIPKLMDMNAQEQKRMGDTLKCFPRKFLVRCFLKRDPLLYFSNDVKSKIYNLLENRKGVEDELECRIRVEGKGYFDCIRNSIQTYDEIVPNIVFYGENNERKSYAVLGDYLVLQSHMVKETISDFIIQKNDVSKLAGYDYKNLKFSLANEHPVKKGRHDLKWKPRMYRYQVRYEFNPLPLDKRSPSVLWRADITEYGESTKSWKDAQRNYELRPKTSIELEYAPGDQERMLLSYNKDFPSAKRLRQMVHTYKLDVDELDEKQIVNAMRARIQSLYNNIPNAFILKDFMYLFTYLLNFMFP